MLSKKLAIFYQYLTTSWKQHKIRTMEG